MKDFIDKKYSVPCLLFLFMFAVMPDAVSYSGENSFTQKDREMLIRVDERLNQMDKRFEELREDMNNRFEQIDKRFKELREDMNNRFEQVDKRFETFQALMIGVVATFGALVAAIIGFALWDRRTMIRPFETRIMEIDEKKEDRKNTERILEALRKVARSDRRLAEALKSVSLL